MGSRSVLYFFLLSSPLAFANLVIRGELASLSISSLPSFKLYQKFLGLPFVLIEQNGRSKKSSVTITPTGIAKIQLEEKLLRSNYDQYREGRKQYASKRGSEILDFLPPLFFNNQSKAQVVSSGYKYKKRNGTKNIERSFYVLCPLEAFHLKILTENNPRGISYVEKLRVNIIGSRCESMAKK